MANPYGDLELDARGMRALAHPVRVRILGELQQRGPSTATRLSPVVGATPSVTSWHLRHLAEHGLVRDAEARGSGRERWWEAVSRGYRLTTEGPGALEAGRALEQVLVEAEGDVVGDWRREVEPTLPREWLEVTGRASTRVLATTAEVRAIGEAIEAVMAPYVLRKDDPDTAPDGARIVHVLQYVMPSGSDDA